MIFANRTVAGQLLAEKLCHLEIKDPVVLALPRGGVPVAAEIAKSLGGQLDILLIKRIISTQHREVAIGAISEGGEVFWQRDLLEHLRISEDEEDRLLALKREEIDRQAKVLRKGREPIDVKGRTVILVDDGLATGSSMLVAIDTLKKRGPSKIVVAVPVAPPSTAAQIRSQVDEIVVLLKPDTFYAVGQWYEDFGDVSDEDVTHLLRGRPATGPQDEKYSIPDGKARLPGILTLVPDAKALILFAHGSASTHRSPRNQFVARALNHAGFGTLLFDLLTESEAEDRGNVFNIDLLARRLKIATRWVRGRLGETCPPIAYFGASTGGAAAIVAADEGDHIFSVVSRGGRPDLAGKSLDRVKSPVLLIVGGADESIIPLNTDAEKRMPHSKLVTIPKAGHLFEEPGTLETVAEYAIDWFENCLISPVEKKVPAAHERIAQDLLQIARPFRRGKDLDSWYENLSKARVVMLGESSHGTQEYYETRKEITERLVRDYGFRFVAVEGDWPDCHRLARYITHGEGGSAKDVLDSFERWPTWMWNNEPTAALIESLRKLNAPFYGLDVYSLFESIDVVKNYSEKLSPKLSGQIQAIYSCFDPHMRTESSYARSLSKNLEGCESEVVDFLAEILRTRLDEIKLTGDEFFDARRNAVAIRNAELYYRAMVFGGPESWNVRDQHMMDTLDALFLRHGEGSKAIVWAHNTHIGDYHATDMVNEGYVNLGGLARERYGIENVHLVGFGTFGGEVLAGSSWGAIPEKMSVPAAIHGSYEHYLHETSFSLEAPALLLPQISTERLASLSTRRGHRAIGVVYQSNEGVHHRNYVPTELARRYDSFIFIDQTTALKERATAGSRKGELPETWPTGL